MTLISVLLTRTPGTRHGGTDGHDWSEHCVHSLPSLRSSVSPWPSPSSMSASITSYWVSSDTHLVVSSLFSCSPPVVVVIDAKSRAQPTARMLVTDKESVGNALGGETCLTSGCVRAAADFLRNMDTSVDPCNDFYRFSCGSWVDSQVIPDDRTSVSIFSLLQDDLNNKLRGGIHHL